MSSNEIAIRVQNLSKCYEIYDRPQDRLKQSIIPRLRRLAKLPPKSYFREFWALKDISFEIKRHESVGIVGRNGAGKSTLLQIICGTLSPTAGNISISGRVAALLELGSGFNPEFTGRENIYMNGALLGLSREEINKRFDDIVAYADIGDFIEQPVKTYSSGMYARLGFAVAIHTDPDVLIIDEALAVGDMPFQTKCFARMNELRARGTTILFVSHSLGTVASFCDRALYLRKGEQIAFGSVNEVAKQYQLDCMEAQLKPRCQSSRDIEISNIPDSIALSSSPDEVTELLPTLLHVHSDYQRRIALAREGTKALTIESFILIREDNSPVQEILPTEAIRGCFLLQSNIDFEGEIHVGITIKDKCGTEYMVIRDSCFKKRLKTSIGSTIVGTMKFSLPLRAGEYYCTVGVLLFRNCDKYKFGMFNFSDAEIADLVEYGAYFRVIPMAHHPIPVPILNESKLSITELPSSPL